MNKMPDTERRFCEYFRYDDDRRLPCLPGCEYHTGGRAKCISQYEEPGCIYPISRKPEIPALMPEPVKWCPGPGGCVHFNKENYKCALKLARKPFEYTYKYQKVHYWDFTFSGKAMIIIGAALVLGSIIYLNIMKRAPLMAGAFAIFGGIVILGGYLMWLWENKSLGQSKGFSFFNRVRSSGAAVDHDKIPDLSPDTNEKPTTISRELQPVNGQGYCPNYYYDELNRLPCIEGCHLWNKSRAECWKPYLSPDCPYPKSRKPVAASMMPDPVGWCPGPGGCEYFNHEDYTCALRIAGRFREQCFKYDQTKRNRIIGSVLMAVGLILGFILLREFAFVHGNPYLGLASFFIGCSIAMIGWVVWRQAK